VLTADMRRRIVEAFGLEPLDFYGTTEAWTSWRTWSWSRWSTSTAGPSRRAPPARVRAALAAEIRDAGAVPPPIEVTPVPRIDRDPGHGAKFKLVRSRPAPSP
jgi:hypothetical protein